MVCALWYAGTGCCWLVVPVPVLCWMAYKRTRLLIIIIMIMFMYAIWCILLYSLLLRFFFISFSYTYIFYFYYFLVISLKYMYYDEINWPSPSHNNFSLVVFSFIFLLRFVSLLIHLLFVIYFCVLLRYIMF